MTIRGRSCDDSWSRHVTLTDTGRCPLANESMAAAMMTRLQETLSANEAQDKAEGMLVEDELLAEARELAAEDAGKGK
jgi:hypothetical protein